MVASFTCTLDVGWVLTLVASPVELTLRVEAPRLASLCVARFEYGAAACLSFAILQIGWLPCYALLLL
jgi:hypothetical protein